MMLSDMRIDDARWLPREVVLVAARSAVRKVLKLV